jgi:hypothetical protein
MAASATAARNARRLGVNGIMLCSDKMPLLPAMML